MAKYFISGLALGIGLTQYTQEESYSVVYSGLYKPHKNFLSLKRQLKRDDLCFNEADYFNYLKQTFISMKNTIYYFVKGKSDKFKLEKQRNCYRLIEQFEFVKETSDNLDYIVDNIKKIQLEEYAKKGSYENFKLIESESKQYIKTADDLNMENLQIVKSKTTDSFEKFNLDKAVVDRGEYLRSLSPEFKIQNEVNRMKLLKNYYDSLENFKSTESGVPNQEQMMILKQNANSISSNRVRKNQENNIKGEKLSVKKDEEEKIYKRANPKNIENELKTLRNIFGNK